MRGQQSLFACLFPQAIDTDTDNLPGKRLFLDRRDDALAYRYYFHAEIKRLRYDDCLLRLEEEFYLSSRAIVLRLDGRRDLLKCLIKDAPTVPQMRRKFPYYSWAV